mgnify:CR=1 FL=1
MKKHGKSKENSSKDANMQQRRPKVRSKTFPEEHLEAKIRDPARVVIFGPVGAPEVSW